MYAFDSGTQYIHIFDLSCHRKLTTEKYVMMALFGFCCRRGRLSVMHKYRMPIVQCYLRYVAHPENTVNLY